MLDEIIKSAVEPEASIGELLRRCKVLASVLGSHQLEDWLLWESSGYPDDAHLPSYRTWPQIIKGTFVGAFGRAARSVTVPPAQLPDKWRDRILTVRCGESIAQIEHILSECDSEMIRTDQGNLVLVLGMTVFEGMNCVSAWGEFHRGRLAGVLDSVRSRVLDFALALKKENPDAADNSTSLAGVGMDKATQIFNTTVLGGDANIVGAATGSNISFGISKGDFESLARSLRKLSISESDLAELHKALQEDPVSGKRGEFGPNVARWLRRMLEKAAAGVWQVGVSSASILLVEAIQQFYGL